MAHDIFISYSRSDLAAVKPIKEELKSLGFACWENLSRKVDGAVDQSTVILFVFSETSLKSERSLRVLQLAKEKGKKVFVVRFNDDTVADSFAGSIEGLEVWDWRNAEQRKRLIAALQRSIGEVWLKKELESLRSEERHVKEQRERLRLLTKKAEVKSWPGKFILAPAMDAPGENVDMLNQQSDELQRRAELLRRRLIDVEKRLAELRESDIPVAVKTFGVAGPLEAGADLGIGVVAPANVPRGNDILVQVVVDVYEGLANAIEKAKSLDAENHAVERGTLPVRGVKNGAEMAFEFDARDLRLDDVDRVQKRTWDGMPFTLQFIPSIPDDIRKGSHSARVLVSVDGRPVGRIGFVINVVDSDAPAGGTAKTAPRGYSEYFVSYADKDFERVLPIVRGIRIKEPDFRFFFDKVTLRAGQHYEKEIFDYIDNKADVFLLFWSANSAASEWVEKEWRRALARQKTKGGIPDIVPVPLDRNGPPPPPELSDLHFKDGLLLVANGRGGNSNIG